MFFSEISKVLLNDIFGELDGSSGIKNIISYANDRLNLGGLKVGRLHISKYYDRKYGEIILMK